MVKRMNTDDLKLMKILLNHIVDLANGNKMLFSVDYGHIAKTNLILLKGLLEDLQKKGLFVTVDRPHQYMEHLLRMHKINYTNLFFLDTITTFSGAISDKNININNVTILDSPFQIDLLPELFSHSNKNIGLKNQIDITGLEFILIDNVASMLNYNDLETVENFLKKYFDKFIHTDRIFLPLLIDKLRHGSLYITAKKWFDVEIDLKSMKNNNYIVPMEKKTIPFPSPQKKIVDFYSNRSNIIGGD